GTEVVKNQLASFPKSVEDDSELKDFDDIVIDNSKDDDPLSEEHAEKSVDDLHHAEPAHPVQAPHEPKAPEAH
ncbi:DUF1269 domain-containing family protein, partial [Lactobacillus sp. XV13L]|nr:DUF1269 domain-containing family protein [Lactobacillus sp. XV13L]